MGITVVGSVFVDIKGYPFSQYIPAGRNAGRVEQTHGGVSRNLVEDIANLELRPAFVSLVDDSGLGIDVIDKLERHHVDTRYIRQVRDGMGTWLAIFDNNGDVVSSISKRPDLMPLLTILRDEGDEIFSAADSIVLEFDMEPPILKEAIRLAKKYGKKIYALISNMAIAMERRDLIAYTDCFVCNQQEAGMLFSEDYEGFEPVQMLEALKEKISHARIPGMVVTMGEKGAVYATLAGEEGLCRAWKVDVIDTTGAGDAFAAGTFAGLTCGKSMGEACDIGARLAQSVITTKENVCPRFRPEEFDL